MPANGVSLPSGSSMPVYFDGGRASLVVSDFANPVQLQLQGPNGNWMNIGSSLVADSSYVFDAPPGQYRIQTSSVLGVNAALVTVPYR